MVKLLGIFFQPHIQQFNHLSIKQLFSITDLRFTIIPFYHSYFICMFGFSKTSSIMKKNLLAIAAAITIACTTQAQPLKTPAPSSTQTVKQDFGLSTVELSYSRPSVKGRKIFGDVVPFGKVWRTGANQATVITFGDDVTFGDKKVPAGKYGLLTMPGEKEWTVILTKQLDVTSPAAYKPEMDVARITVKSMQMPVSIETFMILFDDVKTNSMAIEILWERTVVSIPVSTDVDTKVMKAIDVLVNKDNKPYYNAAVYYMENGKDLNQALTWFDKAVEQNPEAFWVYYQRGLCLAKLGKKEDAIVSAKKSIELAKVAKNDDYVALNEKLIASLK